MKLWLLRPIDDEAGPWTPWYDKAFGFVVRAETETDARALAQECGGPETHYQAWTDNTLSTCVELSSAGDTGVILRHYRRA